VRGVKKSPSGGPRGKPRKRPRAPGNLGVWALKKLQSSTSRGCMSLGALHFVPRARWRIREFCRQRAARLKTISPRQFSGTARAFSPGWVVHPLASGRAICHCILGRELCFGMQLALRSGRSELRVSIRRQLEHVYLAEFFSSLRPSASGLAMCHCYSWQRAMFGMQLALRSELPVTIRRQLEHFCLVELFNSLRPSASGRAAVKQYAFSMPERQKRAIPSPLSTYEWNSNVSPRLHFTEPLPAGSLHGSMRLRGNKK